MKLDPFRAYWRGVAMVQIAKRPCGALPKKSAPKVGIGREVIESESKLVYALSVMRIIFQLDMGSVR